ncbi:MAG: hypothetical protein ABEJ27_06590 [Halodesulfurarchaeum sp.]
MALDVDVPTPPDLTNRGLPPGLSIAETAGDVQDLRRGELESVLGEGAWREAFEEWAQYTDLSATDIEHATTIGLFRAFDFFWDPDARRLRYVTPAIPEDWTDAEAVSAPDVVQAELDDFGRTVAETITSGYIDWGEASSDLVWGVDSFGQVPTGEE